MQSKYGRRALQGFQHSENAFNNHVKTLFQASKIDARHLFVDLQEQHEGVFERM